MPPQKACTFCSRRKIRCNVPPSATCCSSCSDRGILCSLDSDHLFGDSPISTEFITTTLPTSAGSNGTRTTQSPGGESPSASPSGDPLGSQFTALAAMAREAIGRDLLPQRRGTGAGAGSSAAAAFAGTKGIWPGLKRPPPTSTSTATSATSTASTALTASTKEQDDSAARRKVGRKALSDPQMAVANAACLDFREAAAELRAASNAMMHRSSPSVPPLLTPYDDLTPLPSLEIQNALFVASFGEPQAAVPIFHRHSLVQGRFTPFVSISLQALTGSMFGRTAEAEALFRRAAKDVFPALLGLSGTTSKGAMLTVLQAAIVLLSYRFFCVQCTPESPDARWLALAVACAKQMGFCAEDDQLTDPVEKELRRRVWWFLYLCDAFLALTTNIESHISESTCANLHVMGSESDWHNNTPFSPTDTVLWRDVVAALDSSPPTSRPPSLAPLRTFWSRTLAGHLLLKRAATLSRHLWNPDSALPPDFASPPLRTLSASLDRWRHAHAQHHTRGDARASSAGDRRTGDFVVQFYHTAYLVAFSPRFAFDAMLRGDPATGRAGLHPVLAAWARGPFASVCRWHLGEAATFVEGVLSTTVDMGTIFDAEPVVGNVPHGPRTRRPFDASMSHLRILGFSMIYYAVVQVVLDALDPREGSKFEMFERGAFGCLGATPHFLGLWSKVAGWRARLMAEAQAEVEAQASTVHHSLHQVLDPHPTMPSWRSLAVSVVTLVLVALFLPVTTSQAVSKDKNKRCLYHWDAHYKSILVWNWGIINRDVCFYWNYHHKHFYTSLSQSAQYITHICVKAPTQEIGFLMKTPLNEAPDRLFTDNYWVGVREDFGGREGLQVGWNAAANAAEAGAVNLMSPTIAKYQ
ncbi:hypothetical protein HDU96_002698 [Phlyctochytrium bullatum]|nr:hypothetical protein HDU96_002698 [Phlyctochytrium bullatum]